MSFPTPAWLEEAMKKYDRKLNHVKLTKQIRQLMERSPFTISQTAAHEQARLDYLTKKVKHLIDRIGVYADLHPSYLAYAFALDKSQREMTWMVDLIREHQILRQRWEGRGLDSAILDELDKIIIYKG